jgi:benzylsuccinate CoA-transferase BbsF subunit
MMEEALQDLRIIDFTWVLAGPFATRILADWGAEVIKVQSRVTMGEGEQNISGYFSTWNRNKLGITLNLSKPAGVKLAERLIGISDVVIENFTPRVMRNWGLDYSTLRRAKPDLIMLSMSGMGQEGPHRDYTAFGPTIQALSGITYLTTFPGQPPLGLGYSYADHIAGLMGALAILEALEYRQRMGIGQYIDLSELEAMSSLLGMAILDDGVNGRVASPSGNRPVHRVAAPHGAYRCKGEDRWCAIAVFTEKEWEAFVGVMNHPSWTREERFATTLERWQNMDQLDPLVEEWTKERPAEEVMSLLQGVGVAAGVVQDAADLSQDPQLKARGFFVELEHPVSGKIFSDGSSIKLSETSACFKRAAPLLGQDNEYVYRELLGMNEGELAWYIEEGVIT